LTSVFDPYGVVYDKIWTEDSQLKRQTVLREEHVLASLPSYDSWLLQRMRQLQPMLDQCPDAGVAFVTCALVVLMVRPRSDLAATLNGGKTLGDYRKLTCSIGDYEKSFHLAPGLR